MDRERRQGSEEKEKWVGRLKTTAGTKIAKRRERKRKTGGNNIGGKEVAVNSPNTADPVAIRTSQRPFLKQKSVERKTPVTRQHLLATRCF